jgi:NADH-quinone oxidoreductase subunit A
MDSLTEFGHIFLFILGGIMFVLLGLVVNRLISPPKPNAEKLSTYESGEVPIGDAVVQLNTRFYLIGLIFLIFDVEVLFLYPWATVFARRELIAAVPAWGSFAMVEVLVFTGVLLLGLIYAWARGDLDWVQPIQAPPRSLSPARAKRYEAVNERYRKP